MWPQVASHTNTSSLVWLRKCIGLNQWLHLISVKLSYSSPHSCKVDQNISWNCFTKWQRLPWKQDMWKNTEQRRVVWNSKLFTKNSFCNSYRRIVIHATKGCPWAWFHLHKTCWSFYHPREHSHMKLKPEKSLRHTVSFCLHTYRNLSHAPEQCFESKYCFKSMPYVHIHHYIKINHYIILKNLSNRICNLSSSTIISIQLLIHTV